MGSGGRTRAWIGLVLLIVGTLFLLDDLTAWHFPREALWPVALIAVGVANLMRRGSSRWVGAVVTVVGVAFLLDALDVVTFDMGDVGRFWPVLLLIIGVRVLLGGRKAGLYRQGSTVQSDSGALGATYVFGGGKQQITSQRFSGGSVTAVFGSAQIDLRDASLADGRAVIDLTVLFGGVKLRIPDGWAVDVQGTHLLGGVQDERIRSAHSPDGEQLTITGLSMFGGVNIDS